MEEITETKLEREDILQWLSFPVLEEIKYVYGKILIANMVSRTGRSKTTDTGKKYYNGYRFSYGKKLKTGTGKYLIANMVSCTGENKKKFCWRIYYNVRHCVVMFKH